MTCPCDGNCPRCRHDRGEKMTSEELQDLQRKRCCACNCDLGRPGGYFGLGMCGPCSTGESETAKEKGDTW